jgi:response regulator RpfG family c-di-GMP phosphodiesterase
MLDEQWLAEQLKAEGKADQAQLARATHDGTGDLCRDLIANGVIQESELLRFLGLKFQTRYVSTEKLSTAKVLQWVLNLLPMEFCEEHHVLPVRCDKQRTTLSVVTPDPSDRSLLSEISQLSKVKEVMAYVALPHAIEAGIRKFYRGDLHAFARMDESLRQNYSEMLNIYEQRLIDFEGDGETPDVKEDEPVQTFRHDELVIGEETRKPEPAAPTSTPTPPPLTSPTSDFAIIPTSQAAQATSPSTIMPAVHPTGPLPAQSPARTSPSVAIPAIGILQVVEVVVGQLEQMLGGWRAGHSSEVARMAGQLAMKAGLAADAATDLHLAALLHELGKPADTHLTMLNITTDAGLRHKAMQVYQAPSSLVGTTQVRPDVVQILATLYEKHGGGGVPGQLSGEQIPLGARILQVADAYCDLNAGNDASSAAKRLTEAGGAGLLDPSVVAYLTAVKADAGVGQRLVLIVDEDPRSAALLEGQIKSAGYDAVVAATTGDAAMVLLGEPVSLVLSEVNLTPMDGFSFLQWLRSNPRTQEIPFMFVTSRADADDVNRGFELGAIDYIVKPFRPEVVLAKVKRQVS